MKDFNKTKLEFYKNVYDFELARKDNLNSNLNIPLTILSLIAGILGFFYINLPHCNNTISDYLFFGFLILATIVYAFSVYYFFKGLFGFGYGYISDAEKIEKYLIELETYNQVATKSQKIDIETEFYETIMKQYIEYSTLNFKNNNMKSGYLYKTTVQLLIAIVFTILCSFSFIYKKYQANDDIIYRIQVENFPKGEGKMTEKPKPVKNEVPKPPPPPKPERPKGQIIKEEKETKR